MLKIVTIPAAGYGTMSLTAKHSPQPVEVSVNTLLHVYDNYGVRLFNSAKLYTFNPQFNSVEVFAKFFAQRPDPNVVFVYKLGLKDYKPNLTENAIEEDVKELLSKFDGLPVKPKIIIENSRTDKSIPVEEWVKSLYKQVEKGAVDGIGLSEVGAETLKRAAAVAPISVLELELSMITQDTFTNGVLALASELNIPILCYSPMGRGLLTDFASENEDYLEKIGPDDVKIFMAFDRFLPENVQKNRQMLKFLYDMAKAKGGRLEQLAIAYIYKLSGQKNFKGIAKVTQLVPIPGGTTVDKVDKNYGKKLEISDEEFAQIQTYLDTTPVAGGRYNAALRAGLDG